MALSLVSVRLFVGRLAARVIRRFGLHLSEAHLAIGAIAVLAVVFSPLQVWAKVLLALPIALLSLVSFDGWLFTGWIGRALGIRRPTREQAPSETDRGSIAFPGEDVAVRWDGPDLVGLVAVHARPLGATVVVNGQALHDDVVDTRVVEESLRRSGIDAIADIVSPGYRVAPSAPGPVYGWGEELLGADPAPALRRMFIEIRVDPTEVYRQTRWRGEGLKAVANAVVSVATRVADDLSAVGVDARPAATFDLYDQLTGRGEVITEQQWSALRLKTGYTTMFYTPGGPDVWWSVRALRTVTRTRVRVGHLPSTVVALTTHRPIERDPNGWTRLRGIQLEALRRHSDVPGEHLRLPVGSAGVLVGRTALDGSAMYVSFDTAEASLQINDAQPLSQELALRIAVRASAAGAQLCLPNDMGAVAAALRAPTGQQPHYRWPGAHAATWLGTHRSGPQVTLSPLMIELPTGQYALQPVNAREEAVIGVRIPAPGEHIAQDEKGGSQLAGGYGKWSKAIERSNI